MKQNKDVIRILADIFGVDLKDKDADAKILKKLKTANVPAELKQSAMNILMPTTSESVMNFKDFRKKLMEHGSVSMSTSSDVTKPVDNDRNPKHKGGDETGKFADVNMDIEDGMEHMSDEEIDAMLGDVNDLEDLVDLGGVDSDELHVVSDAGDSVADVVDDDDDEAGESAGKLKKSKQDPLEGELSAVDEAWKGLTVADRIKRRQVFARSAAKRQHGMKLALHTMPSPQRIEERARRTAVGLLKRKLSNGKSDSELTIPEKQRMEKIIAKKGPLLAKMAAKLTSKVKQIAISRFKHRPQ